MREIDLDEGIASALDALNADRLAMLCGAGLSMASPSNLPSAAQLALQAKRKYDSFYGATRAPLSPSIEEQAEFFFQRGELGTMYLRALIDAHAFAGPPNAGHTAVADLLLVRAIQTAVSTNVDTLIEAAGLLLLGQVGVGIERRTVAALPPDISPLLKIHGCWSSDRDNTLWASGQLAVEPAASRIQANREWLLTRLLDRDLIIVGYFTDWDYLNEVLERTLGEVRPARVLIVDPGPGATLAAKAPILHGLGGRAQVSFCHVRISGAEFLERLRLEFSQAFVRRLLHAGSEAYEHRMGAVPDRAWLEPPGMGVADLWQVRRDLEGCLPNEPARHRMPPEEPVLGLMLLELRAKGATADGPYWLLGGQRIRVLRTPNQLLHMVRVAFERETPPVVAPDVIIAVGAEASSLPPHIVRSGTTPSITRGSAGQWLLKEGDRLLRTAAISTRLIETTRGKALAFEGTTILGFVVVYQDCGQLIERWSADASALVAESQLSLRRAQNKAWNTYTVLLAVAEASYGERVTLSAIEEDLTGTRKLARAGISDVKRLHAALLPLLPIQNAPQLEAVDMPSEIRLRTTQLPTRVVDAFLSGAQESSVVQILEEEP